MKTTSFLYLLLVALLITGCASAPVPKYQKNSTDLIVQDYGDEARIVQPASLVTATNEDWEIIGARIAKLPDHSVAAVVLEETPKKNERFADRTALSFIKLRSAKYRDILYLQGQNTNDADGLVVFVHYY